MGRIFVGNMERVESFGLKFIGNDVAKIVSVDFIEQKPVTIEASVGSQAVLELTNILLCCVGLGILT